MAYYSNRDNIKEIRFSLDKEVVVCAPEPASQFSILAFLLFPCGKLYQSVENRRHFTSA